MATETQIVREGPEVEAYKLSLLEEAKKLADQPIDLPAQQIAEMSALQTGAMEAAAPSAEGIGGYQPYLEQAGYSVGDAGAALDPNNISTFMNPYQDAIQAEIVRAYQPQFNQGAATAVGSGAFGGSRAAIQNAEIQRNMASALAQSQAQNFLQAQKAQLDQADALGTLGLRQAALGEQAQNQALTDITAQYEFGKQQQAFDQAGLEAKRQSDLAQLYEPYQRYGFLSDIYKGAPTSQMSLTSSTAPSVSPFQQYLGMGIGALSAYGGAQKAGLFS